MFDYLKNISFGFVLFGLAGLLYCQSALSESPEKVKKLFYGTYDSKSKEYISEYAMIVGPYKDAKREVTVEYEGVLEKYNLDYEFQTSRLKYSDKFAVTNYTGIRYGDQFVITGIVAGESISRTLIIDSLPFYFNPKVGLMDFVLRGEKKREFWGIRNDTLSTYRMVVKNMGTEIIEINGDPVESVKVYWAPVGMASMFFHRTYWFRKSDGIFLKSVGSNNRTRILVREE